MTMVMDDVIGREARHVLQTYRRQPITFVRGPNTACETTLVLIRL